MLAGALSAGWLPRRCMLEELLLAVPAARALASAAAGRADAVVDEREQLFNESLMMPGPATASPQRGCTDRCLTHIHLCRTCLPVCNKRILSPTSQVKHRTWVQHGHQHFAVRQQADVRSANTPWRFDRHYSRRPSASCELHHPDILHILLSSPLLKRKVQ